MHKIIVSFFVLFALTGSAFAQGCAESLTNLYSDSALWVHIGSTNDVTVSGDSCTFDNLTGDHHDKVYFQLPFTLSDNYWKAEIKYTITATNPADDGANGIIMAMTAGTQDYISDDTAAPFMSTTQDGIAVTLYSANSENNDVNDWEFSFESKKDSTRTIDSNFIYVSDTINTYYIRLERIALDSVRLTVCTDSLFATNLTGSPETFPCDSSIAGLHYIQQGNFTAGFSSRDINAVMSGLNICSAVATGIKEDAVTTSSVDLYPNPASDLITLRWSDPGMEEILVTLYSENGKILYRETVAPAAQQMDLVTGYLASGIYFITLVNKKGETNSKMFEKE